MSKLLIVSATTQEIQALLDHYSVIIADEGLTSTMINEQNELNILITGVGMVNMAYWLGRFSNHIFDGIINAGISGAFQTSLKKGDVVRVYSDVLCEMGAEDGDKFIPYEKLNLGGSNAFQEKWALSLETVNKLKKVKGVTVNKVHGNAMSIVDLTNRLHPDVESMEGAAFFSACRRFSNYTQIKAISNMVEVRNKDNWDIPLAVKNLNATIIKITEEFFSEH